MKMSINNLYNIAFLLLWCITASSIDVVAANVFCPGQPSENFCDCGGDCTGNPDFCACDEAKACCLGATPVVLCPDQPKENYCDCDGDCTNKPEWCQCEDAQECCGGTSPNLLPSSFNSVFGKGESDNILCPGQPTENFCDCEGDCTGNPDFCACDEAKACCLGATPVVLCPDQPAQNYCDCTGDCTEEPQWCQCADAQKCCNEYSLRKKQSFFVLLSAVSVASFLIGFLFLYNKKVKGRQSSLSEAAVSVKSPPRSSSKSDDDVTVGTANSHDL